MSIKALEKNNLTPLRVEFFKDDIESQRSAAKKISRGFAEYEEALKKVEENLKNENAEESLTEASLINESILKKPLDNIKYLLTNHNNSISFIDFMPTNFALILYSHK